MRIRKLNAYRFLGAGFVLFALLACNLTAQRGQNGTDGQPTQAAVEQTEPPVVLPSPTTAQPVEASATSNPEPTEQAVQPTPAVTQGPVCEVLTDLNLRSGPGTAYRPPVRSLPAGTELVPLGYNPQGVPGGPWVQVKDETSNEIGWVSAGEQFVSCNIDITQLPSVAVDLPAPPPPPKISDSKPDGNFPETWVWELDFSKEYLLRMKVYDTLAPTPEGGGALKDGDGIAQVDFTVTDADKNIVYQHTENTAGYCIFGGGEPDCNPWVIEDYTYKWEKGGQAIKSGDYKFDVNVAGSDGVTTGHWEIKVNLNFP